MKLDREKLADYIVKRFSDEISGTQVNRWVNKNPEEAIYIGKLSPQVDGSGFSSNVLIKQISIDFFVRAEDIKDAVINIFPQGNFFVRVLPTLEEQRSYFLAEVNDKYVQTFSSFDEMLDYFHRNKTFQVDVNIPLEKDFKIPMVAVFEKVSLESNCKSFQVKLSDIYDHEVGIGGFTDENSLKDSINCHLQEIVEFCNENYNVLRSEVRSHMTIEDIKSEECWERFLTKALNKEYVFLDKLNYAINVTMREDDNRVRVTVSLSNETDFVDDISDNSKDKLEKKYRISTLFNSGIKVEAENFEYLPVVLNYFEDDYKYDKNVFAIGGNCNIEYDLKEPQIIQTTHLPVYIQKRLKTKDALAVSFSDLISSPVKTLEKIYSEMLKELRVWNDELEKQKLTLTTKGLSQFKEEIDNFEIEISRFKTGLDLIKNHQIIRDAFVYMNQAFWESAKGIYDNWRLFQIVFIVSLILDVVANEPILELEQEIKNKAKTDWLDVLYFPTGGGKTEAFLGVLVFNLFFDRIRGKDKGVTAILKYPLRLLSIQQVQRVANILAKAEIIRRDKIKGNGIFTLGYYVGDANTPNNLDEKAVKEILGSSQDQNDKKYKILDICPFCKEKDSISIHLDVDRHKLIHKCNNPECVSGGALPLYIVDNEIYRYLPSVIISTVDKLAAIGYNENFQNILRGAEKFCPLHGYTNKRKCLVGGCQQGVESFKDVEFKDPAPSLIIQDELHLIRESLGTYASHYETLFDYYAKTLSPSKRGIKVIGATATISGMEQHSIHLFRKYPIRFPAASPFLDHNFYSYIDNEEICRIIIGYAPFGKAIINSVAYSLQYLRKVVWSIYKNPKQLLDADIDISGLTEQEKIDNIVKLIEDYWIVIEYNNVKLDSNNVMGAIEDPINTQLISQKIDKIVPRKMTGDDTFQEVRGILANIENAKNVITDLDFNMIAATSMISHGVDANRFNVMFFYGMPGNTAEYIQAYSRVGRKHTGIVIDIMRPAREKDQSYLKNFVKFHEFKDILVETVPINRWATRAIEATFPGILAALIINYYGRELQYEFNSIYNINNVKKAIIAGKLDKDALKKMTHEIYKCTENDQAIGTQYRIKIDQLIDQLFESIINTSFDKDANILEGFDKVKFHIMTSLRDTDERIIVELK